MFKVILVEYERVETNLCGSFMFGVLGYRISHS